VGTCVWRKLLMFNILRLFYTVCPKGQPIVLIINPKG